MKWFWWIGGAFLYLILKDRNGNDSILAIIGFVILLTACSMIGGHFERKALEREQAERDRLAAETAKALEAEMAAANAAASPDKERS